ncbi:hypothetical protein R1sor_015527 [Riccia sorocarpa]|uniref:Uncharacterized protein n=1 Tax=Riccia sorocarpa TaxID=122646 RepID=A0ABD3HCU5_9MARC
MASFQEEGHGTVEGLYLATTTQDESGATEEHEEPVAVIGIDGKQVEGLEQDSGVTSVAVMSQHNGTPRSKKIDAIEAHHSWTPLRTTSPLRSKSPLRRASPERTRKFFQEKVHEVVVRSRYGQWDFDFSPRSPRMSDDDMCPPWGQVPAKDIFANILRPSKEDPLREFRRQRSLTTDAQGLPTCPLPE